MFQNVLSFYQMFRWTELTHHSYWQTKSHNLEATRFIQAYYACKIRNAPMPLRLIVTVDKKGFEMKPSKRFRRAPVPR